MRFEQQNQATAVTHLGVFGDKILFKEAQYSSCNDIDDADSL